MYQQTLLRRIKVEISGKRQRVFLHMSRSLRFCLPRFYSLGIEWPCVSVGLFQRSLVGYQDYDCSVDLSTHFFFLILLYYKHYDSHDTVHDGIWVA